MDRRRRRLRGSNGRGRFLVRGRLLPGRVPVPARARGRAGRSPETAGRGPTVTRGQLG